MATGRTTPNWLRVYADGYDLSGYANQVGPLMQEFGFDTFRAFTDEVLNGLNGHADLGIGTLNGILDNSTSGLHEVANNTLAKRVCMVAVGIRAAPAQGDPAYCGEFEQGGYQAVPADEGLVAVSIPFRKASGVGSHLAYDKPWGTLLHAKGAETAVNAATGDDKGAATARGGFLCYQLFSSNGTVTLKVQDAATNADGSFADLSGATSGSITAAVTPKSGIVALATTATVRRYLRWQLVFGTATTATFALAFVRG